MDDLFFTGDSKYINEIFLPKIQGKIDASVSGIERIGDEFNFLRRKCKLEVDGLWIQPGNYIQQMLKAYEEQIGWVKLQQLPADNSTQMEDKSEVLHKPNKMAFSEALFKSYSHVIASLEKDLVKFEEDHGLLSGAWGGEGYVKKGES